MVGARVRGLVIIVFHEHTGTRRISEGSNVEIRGWDKKNQLIYHHNCSRALLTCMYANIHFTFLSLPSQITIPNIERKYVYFPLFFRPYFSKMNSLDCYSQNRGSLKILRK